MAGSPPKLRLKLPDNERKLVAAQGATIASDPEIKQVLQGIRAGEDPAAVLAQRHSGLLKAKLQEARNRHSGKYGFSRRTAESYLNTLTR